MGRAGDHDARRGREAGDAGGAGADSQSRRGVEFFRHFAGAGKVSGEASVSVHAGRGSGGHGRRGGFGRDVGERGRPRDGDSARRRVRGIFAGAGGEHVRHAGGDELRSGGVHADRLPDGIFRFYASLPASRRRVAAGARRRERRRHGGDSDRQGAGRKGDRDGRQRRETRVRARAGRGSRHRLYATPDGWIA